MTHHKVMGAIAGLGLFIACATLKRAAHDEVQCLVPTAEVVQACASVNPITACPALAAWFQCLEQADAKNQPVKVMLPQSSDGGVK